MSRLSRRTFVLGGLAAAGAAAVPLAASSARSQDVGILATVPYPFKLGVASGSVVARSASAHSVHVVAGGLAPDADYFYRFRAQGHISPVGRTRTTPAVGTFGRDLVMCF